ncbi:MAG: hypothetical protein AAGF77_00690 [Bacteroidota bacterium]
MRNLSWEKIKIPIALDTTIGLRPNGNKVALRQYHPIEKVFEEQGYGTSFTVEVLPFRSCLIKISNTSKTVDFGISGVDFQTIVDADKDTIQIKLLGLPGSSKTIQLTGDYAQFSNVALDGNAVDQLLKAKELPISFPGKPLALPHHRKLSDLEPCPIPEDALSLYEATQFAADNNALEVRSLKRSGDSQIPQAQAARDAFFGQRIFKEREIWDKYLFDGDLQTAFSISTRHTNYHPLQSALRIDLGTTVSLDSLVLHVVDEMRLQPYKSGEVEYVMVSKDLKEWESMPFLTGTHMQLPLNKDKPIRYLRFPYSIQRLQEVEGFLDGQLVDRKGWRASNLQRPYVFDWHWDKTQHYYAQKAWSQTVVLDEIPKDSYLCVAINGEHGKEGAIAAFKVDGNYVGCPDRSPSYKSNTWEYRVIQSDKNYTYYLPLSPDMAGKSIEAFVLAFDGQKTNLQPQLWITAYPIPYEERFLTLIKKK